MDLCYVQPAVCGLGTGLSVGHRSRRSCEERGRYRLRRNRFTLSQDLAAANPHHETCWRRWSLNAPD